MSEKRKHPRVPCRLRCWCQGGEVTVFAKVSNLSEGGLFIRTSTPLAKGSRAEVRLSGEEPLELRARVAWSRVDGDGGPPGMGLALDPLDPQRREVLRRIIHAEQQHLKANGG